MVRLPQATKLNVKGLIVPTTHTKGVRIKVKGKKHQTEKDMKLRKRYLESEKEKVNTFRKILKPVVGNNFTTFIVKGPTCNNRLTNTQKITCFLKIKLQYFM